MTLEEIAAMQAENAALKKQAEDAKKAAEQQPDKKDPPKDEESLNEKVRKENEEKKKKVGEEQKLASALRFNLTSDKFIEEHKSILPKEMAEIFARAQKETYDSEVEKANTTKAAYIEEFFKVQANMDLLTDTHKSMVDDYLKLTKKGREERADDTYKNIFEPALNMLKMVKKAEEVQKAKHGIFEGSDADKSYMNRLTADSKKHYLGEKK